MTESDWFRCTSRPADMLRHVRHTTPARKLQLLGCACCRLVWEHMPEAGVMFLTAVEQYRDVGLGDTEYTSAMDHIWEAFIDVMVSSNTQTIESAALMGAYAAVSAHMIESPARCLEWVQETSSRAAPDGEKQAALIRTRQQICALFREIIGNPFRPWKAVPDFLGGGVVQPDGNTVRITDTARRLAESIRADQAFDRLPILADALEEAGVTDAEILAHCRRDGGHVRGCWALDVVLGKG